ncbi:MAG: DUF2780 domain-containing protein [Lentisphaerae bacterium]|nr:DUF2780 domain-containing protein [Lentisphaerota bacterium]
MTELIGTLVKQLGVSEGQAEGGAGLLFKLAKDQLGGDFSKVAQAMPEVQGLIGKAPESGGAAKILGGIASMLGGEGGGAAAGKLAGLASLAGGFSNLKLDSGMIAKFVPVVLEFVKSQKGQELFALLASALKR